MYAFHSLGFVHGAPRIGRKNKISNYDFYT